MAQELYELPQGWEWEELGNLTSLENGDRGKNYPSRKHYVSEGIPFITAANIADGIIDSTSLNFIQEEKFSALGSGKIKMGDFLFCLRGSLGKFAHNTSLKEGGIVSSLVIIRPNDTLIPEFLSSYFRSHLCESQIKQYDNGSAQPNLSSRNVKLFQIPVPTLAEQERIVAKLDALFSRIDQAIAQLQHTQAQTKALWNSALDAAFESEKHKYKTIKEISNLVTDGTHHSPKIQHSEAGPKRFKYLTSKNVKFHGLKLDNLIYIDKDVHEEIYNRCPPEYLDQLITKDGAMTGTCCLNTLDEPYSLLSSVALVKLKREVMEPHFLNYFLRSPRGQNSMLEDIAGAAITRTTLTKLKALKIPLPPLSEQSKIVSQLDAISERTQALSAANSAQLKQLETLIAMTDETMTVEFKSNLKEAKEIGAYISCLANSACLLGHEHAWLVWGVDDTSHTVKGTHFDPFKQKVGNQGLIMWLQQKTTPRADFEFHRLERAEGTVILLEIRPPRSAPIAFEGIRYIRIDSHKTRLSEHPDKESRIWEQLGIKNDWTGEIVPDATLEDLDEAALAKARERFSDFLLKNEPDAERQAALKSEIATWDTVTLLNKARITKAGKITRSALLLLGKDESAHFLSPADIKLSWILREANGVTRSSQPFGPPFLLTSDQLFQRIRNLSIDEMPDGTLFPVSIQ